MIKGMPFTIYPAIDIREGRCVRLKYGAADQETRYFEDPLEAAKIWQAAGAEFLHVVDLDGAFAGTPQNLAIIERIAGLGLSVQLGGGLRSTESVKAALDAGCVRAIIGTRAARDPEWVNSLIAAFGERIVAGIDSRGGRVAVQGWVDTTSIETLGLAKALESNGVRTLIHTDIDTDGTLEGPNLAAQEALLQQVGMRLIASGGVATLEDIERLHALSKMYPHLDGVIVGKALYEGKVDLAAAIEQVRAA